MLKDLNYKTFRKISSDALSDLCEELRETIYNAVMQNGGHLSSNLGSIESIVALCKVFDFTNDKIVFDVGHQCYAYKLLTDRYNKFNTLRKRGGISGFPKRSESDFDFYDTGHAGTSISAALGIAKARDIKKENFYVIAYIGDGAFNNGLIYEALNSIKVLNTKILIVLNDNEMSISDTVGGMHDILNEIRNGSNLNNVKLLESFGLKYIGVKDGNDVNEMIASMEETKNLLNDSSVLLHISTKKGKGYEFCEEDPLSTHGLSPLNKETKREYSSVLGETLSKLSENNDKFVAITAAMTDNLGLRDFFDKYPERAFDIGICEENACVLASSMATQGLKPYYAIYSTFLQRSFDEIVHDVCGQDLPVTFCIDRGGVSGSDGETHQGVFDLSYLSMIPNLTIAVPKDIVEFKKMLIWSADFAHPLAIRYPRISNNVYVEDGKGIDFTWEYLKKSNNSKLTILACGERCINLSFEVYEYVKKYNVEINVVNARFVKPIDIEFIKNIDTNKIITIEDNVLLGGFGEKVKSVISDLSLNKDVVSFGYRDEFIPHGEVGELMQEFGLNKDEIIKQVLK